MRGPTRGSRDGKVGCAKRSEKIPPLAFSYPYRFTLPSLFVKIPFALKKAREIRGRGAKPSKGEVEKKGIGSTRRDK